MARYARRRRAGSSLVRLYARVFIVGAWALIIGAVTVVGAVKALAASGPGESTGLRASGLPVMALLAGSLAGLVDVGLSGIGVGAVAMVVGTRFLLKHPR